MKLLLLGVFALALVVLPMYLLDTLLMPELNALKTTYATAGDVANSVADTPRLNGNK